jgi:hypothetical protein
MNININTYRVKPKLNEINNVILTLEVIISKTMMKDGKEQDFHVLRNFVLEEPSIDNFVSIEQITEDKLMEWVYPEIQKDTEEINKVFNRLSGNLVQDDTPIEEKIINMQQSINASKAILAKKEEQMTKLIEQQNQ